ncbi:MAG: HipA domain-containing protein [Muribaculaceae bacterium]|nr:HipA domain-containing protein [Muribaculaceae bacterium]
MNKCLYCYKPLVSGEKDYHKSCARKIFESTSVPELPYTRDNIKELAKEIVTSSTTVTGVQAKLSLDISRGSKGEPQRFTIVGLWGRFILKPQTDRFANLPENEDLVMHLAEAAGIKTVPHSLIRFADGELCYITRRIDRTKKGEKIAMEDMCQLSERLTEDKYKGSYERIAKLIRQHSSAPLLDIVNFWEVVLFSWLTGNADMHLKNFSLFKPRDNYMLTPAYDLLSTTIVMPEDDEELALTLNGKKKKIKRQDFEKSMRESGMDEKAISNVFTKFSKALPKWTEIINESFLPVEKREELLSLISRMATRIRLIDVNPKLLS